MSQLHLPDSIGGLDDDLDLADAIEEYCTITGQTAATATKLANSAIAAIRESLVSDEEELCDNELLGATLMRSRPTAAAPYERRKNSAAQFHLRGTEANCHRVAQLCHVSTAATSYAARFGTLQFHYVHGFPSWILGDQRFRCAEARRLDGKPFPPRGRQGSRQAQFLQGSQQSWPVGIPLRDKDLSTFRAVLAVESGVDYLAALHFTLAAPRDCLPVAFLGPGAGSAASIHPEALSLLAGLRVRFYPHHHSGESSLRAMERRALQLIEHGCHCDAFSFAGLRRADGQPVKSLTDCIQIHPDDSVHLQELLP
jgi:hypothetical protein